MKTNLFLGVLSLAILVIAYKSQIVCSAAVPTRNELDKLNASETWKVIEHLMDDYVELSDAFNAPAESDAVRDKRTVAVFRRIWNSTRSGFQKVRGLVGGNKSSESGSGGFTKFISDLLNRILLFLTKTWERISGIFKGGEGGEGPLAKLRAGATGIISRVTGGSKSGAGGGLLSTIRSGATGLISRFTGGRGSKGSSDSAYSYSGGKGTTTTEDDFDFDFDFETTARTTNKFTPITTMTTEPTTTTVMYSVPGGYTTSSSTTPEAMELVEVVEKEELDVDNDLIANTTTQTEAMSFSDKENSTEVATAGVAAAGVESENIVVGGYPESVEGGYSDSGKGWTNVQYLEGAPAGWSSNPAPPQAESSGWSSNPASAPIESSRWSSNPAPAPIVSSGWSTAPVSAPITTGVWSSPIKVVKEWTEPIKVVSSTGWSETLKSVGYHSGWDNAYFPTFGSLDFASKPTYMYTSDTKYLPNLAHF